MPKESVDDEETTYERCACDSDQLCIERDYAGAIDDDERQRDEDQYEIRV
jgi:hypothetical protein